MNQARLKRDSSRPRPLAASGVQAGFKRDAVLFGFLALLHPKPP
jgi:hypothetical protein